MSSSTLPVVIIGAGPVGLAAAAHVLSRGLTPLVLESGSAVGVGVRRWGHVRMFSPWSFSVDSAAKTILERCERHARSIRHA
jgi:flavin-dependent dehydrogenase